MGSEIIFTPLAIYKKVERWKRALPNITPFFAIKSNPHPEVLKHIALTIGENYDNKITFDCASEWEMKTALKLGATSNDILFSHPTKLVSDIRYARENGIKKMIFDCESELLKVAQHYPEADLLLRITTDDRYSKCKFSSKFGAKIEEVPRLFQCAKEYNLNIVGISFHVGSNCSSPVAFETALKDSFDLCKLAKEYQYKVKIIDIGGGFSTVTFPRVSEHIASVLHSYEAMLKEEEIEIVAEPGRFFVEDSKDLIIEIIGEKVHMSDDAKIKMQYTINDSVYNTLNNIIMDHFEIKWNETLCSRNENMCGGEELFETTIFGNTCDGADVICKSVLMPRFHIGEKLIIKNIGAYTTMFVHQNSDNIDEMIQSFNGFQKAKMTLS